MTGREVTPRDVLADLFEGTDDIYIETDMRLSEPQKAAEVVIEYLRDAGFEIVPIKPAE